MKKNIKIVLIIIVIFIVIICITKILKNTENGNLSNMGLVAEQDGVIYYNKYEKGIFAYKNGEEKQLTNGVAYSLNIVDDKIYYLTVEGANNVIIKSVDITGENEKNIAIINTSISKIFVNEKYIYYITNSKNGGIAQIDLNGKNESIIVSENVLDFHVIDDEIFYINSEHKICKKTSQNNNTLNDEIEANKFQVFDKWIYYYNTKENALFRIKKNGTKNELVSVLVKNETYNVTNDYVYFFDKENLKISRMKIGNSNKCDEIVDVNTTKTKINIAKDELYYLDKSKNDLQAYQIYRVKANGDETTKIEY